MKRLLILGMVLIATTALAFGGSGSGRKSTAFTAGVDAIGVHFNGKTCPEGQELVDNECMDKCAEGVIRGRNNNCDICENDNVYLSYMPEFGVGACDTSTPMNEATSGCECTNADGKCVSYEYDSMGNYICATSDATPCKSNKDCMSTEYCALTNTAPSGCIQPNVGTCMPLTDGVFYTYNDKMFLRSDNYMTWWSAENWCKAKGMQMVALADTDIDKDNLGDFFNDHGWCSCSGPKVEKCENVNWDELRAIFPDTSEKYWYWWVRDNFRFESGAALSVDLDYGDIYIYCHGDYDFYALCVVK